MKTKPMQKIKLTSVCGILNTIPHKPGIYIVWYSGKTIPKFVKEGTGGFFKGKDPNESIKKLTEKWVNGSDLIYIGKATDLNSRICQYMQFGRKCAIGHRGGRYIWQIEDLEKLTLSWEVLLSEPEAKDKERRICESHKAKYNKLPFANLRCG